MLKAEYDNYFETKTFKISQKNVVECSLNLSEENADKILSLTGKVFQPTNEKEETALVYGGLATFNAVFFGDELMRMEVGAKFSFKAQLPCADCKIRSVNYSLYGIRVKAEGGMLYASANLVTEITYALTEDKNYLVSVDALTKKSTMKKFSEKTFAGSFNVQDEFDVKKIKRVLWSDADAVVKDVKTGINEVTVEGVAVINVLMLPFSENSDIIKEVRLAPFRYEIDADGVEENMAACAQVVVDKLNFKVFVDEEKNKATVSYKIDINVGGVVVRCDEADYIEDCYSADNELLLTHAAVSFDAVRGVACFSDRVSGRADCAVPEYARLLKLMGESVETASFTIDDGKLKVDGLIRGEALFAGEEDVVTTRSFLTPFSVAARTDAKRVEDVKVIAEEVFGKLRGGGLDIDATLTIAYTEYDGYGYDVLTEVVEGEKKNADHSAISVYLGKSGDTEWDVTKKLGVDMDTIMKTNPEITFPLSGEERIVIFRKL